MILIIYIIIVRGVVVLFVVCLWTPLLQMIFALDALINKHQRFTTIWNPASLCFLSVLAVPVLVAQFYRGPYKRLEAERMHLLEDD